MKKIMLIILSSVLLGCSNQPKTIDCEEMEIRHFPPTVVLQPCNTFTEKEAQDLVPRLKRFIGGYSYIELDFEILPKQNLDTSFLNQSKTRYRADRIINSLANKASNYYVIIALTHDDISISYKGKSDWGVLGLSLPPKYVCVASDYRLRNKQRDFWKVVIHEFIHTYHRYPHCPKDNSSCIMRDAKGHADFSNKSTLCSYCDSVLNI